LTAERVASRDQRNAQRSVILQHAEPSDLNQATEREVLAGLVERVTFHNVENGFCVLRVKARGHRELITVVGHAATINAGEWITASGEWVNDRTHGQQFKARFLRCSAPTSADGIEKYLASGMIRGIGPVYAKKLVRAFGERVFDVIEAEPEQLRQVDGTGESHKKIAESSCVKLCSTACGVFSEGSMEGFRACFADLEDMQTIILDATAAGA
jgi:ATP-dependent exoDNAse (exonuclease V) alpha subunit